MDKETIQKYVNLVKEREETKKVTRVELTGTRNDKLKIYYLITREYAAKFNLDYTARVFEYSLNIPNLSHTMEYADMNYVYGIEL